ncbi:MAG: molybdate ABC transporter substrate-binding protein [Acidobacteria bacterium RIFCSPLOWO2_12_FULL_54_10]|nr:MAG: molybdate ABC transporter substrate-binding protein [Acidobacteria bacterium RIFCSPLOWO2_12_FULL_54_10]
MHIDNIKLPLLLRAIILSAVFLQSCQQPPQTDSNELVVAAASDLMKASQDLKNAFEQTSNTKVKFSFGPSGQLEQQIRQGAPFDVFLPAAISYGESLQRDDLLDGNITIYAIGRLVAWSSSIQINSLDDLRLPDIRSIALANPQYAPYGVAARQALQSLGLWEAVQPKLLYAYSVANALQLAETGSADVALVAVALVQDTGSPYLLIDSALHAPIQQAAVVLRSSQNLPAARAFVEFLQSEQAQNILRMYGFEHP